MGEKGGHWSSFPSKRLPWTQARGSLHDRAPGKFPGQRAALLVECVFNFLSGGSLVVHRHCRGCTSENRGPALPSNRSRLALQSGIPASKAKNRNGAHGPSDGTSHVPLVLRQVVDMLGVRPACQVLRLTPVTYTHLWG